MSINWPRKLVSDLARRRCVLFLGAGVSAHSRNDANVSPPLWEGFLRRAIANLPQNKKNDVDKFLTNKDLLGAGERVKTYLGRELIDVVRELFSAPRFKPAVIHRHLLRLDARIVITTNFDKIYEILANSADELAGSVIIKNFSDHDLVSVLRGDNRTIIRLHGSVDNAEDLILARSDYARARVKLYSSYEAMEALATTHTFFFIGYSLRDPDLQLILENHAIKHPTARYHYACYSSTPDDLEYSFYRDNLRVQLLPYLVNTNPVDGSQDHSDLVDSLALLIPEVESERDKLRTSLEW